MQIVTCDDAKITNDSTASFSEEPQEAFLGAMLTQPCKAQQLKIHQSLCESLNFMADRGDASSDVRDDAKFS